tara:strand:+ start:966 stop:1385 length:420 start_codon:yes stop_codon:yes gene_type:complete
MFTVIFVPLYTTLFLYGPPALVGWLMKRIQKALGRISPRSTYLRRRVFIVVWGVMVLYFVYATYWQISVLRAVPYEPHMQRIYAKIFVGAILEWITIILTSLTLRDTQFMQPSRLASLFIPYSNLSAKAIKDLEERPDN